MRKTLYLLLIAAIFILSACAGSEQTATTQTPEPSPEMATATSPSAAMDTATTEPETVLAETGSSTECSVTGILAAVDPTTQALFPQISEDEWTTGPEDAYLTIIDYSDFQ